MTKEIILLFIVLIAFFYFLMENKQQIIPARIKKNIRFSPVVLERLYDPKTGNVLGDNNIKINN